MNRALALASFGVAFAGCGTDEDRASAPSGATPKATATAPPTAEDAAAAKAAVAIKGFTYDPARVTVRQGGKVTWTNKDASNHTVTFEKGGPDDVGNLREGRKATVTFDERGRYAYICEFHPGMAGTVEVQ